MKLFFSFVFTVLFFQTFSQNYEQAISKARFLIENHRNQTNTPGIQIAVMVDDSLVWSEGIGYSDITSKTAVNTSTKFRIASISKSVTSVALGKMIEEGEINLDDEIHQFLPDYPHTDKNITIRHLASSTSGIRHYNENDPTYNSMDYPTIQSSLERFKNDELLFNPGERHHYSSYGWVLLSAVMEKAAEGSFFKIMDETWKELGMKNTTFDYPDITIESKSTFYVYDKRKGRVEAPYDNRSYMYAGGGYLSTSEDLVKMANTLLYNRYISDSTKAELFTSYQLQNGIKTHYGLGWETGQSRLGTPIIYHSGNLSTSRSHLILYPEEKVTMAFLTNTGDQIFFNAREAQSIAELFVEAKRNTSIIDKPHDLGVWKIGTKSLRNKKSKGQLKLKVVNDNIQGTILFKRSRKKKEFPIIVTNVSNDTLHLIAVSPMFIDFYLVFNKNSFDGIWLHDFNVNGIPEEDEYWAKRKIVGNRE